LLPQAVFGASRRLVLRTRAAPQRLLFSPPPTASPEPDSSSLALQSPQMSDPVSAHYTNLLARHYSWMFGLSFDEKVTEQRTLLEPLLENA